MSQSASFSVRTAVRTSRLPQPSRFRQLCAAIEHQLGEAAHLPSSLELRQALPVAQPSLDIAIATSASTRSAQGLHARAELLAAVATGLATPVAQVVDVMAPGLRPSARHAARAAEGLVAGGDLAGADRALAAAEAEVVQFRRGTVAVLAEAERVAVAAVAEDALRAIGYRDLAVAEDVDAGITAIHAEQGDRAVALLVRDGGAVELDIAGCEGLSCRPEADRFLRAVAEHGGQVSGYACTWHGEWDGGSLIREAGAYRRRQHASWAEALLAVGGASSAGSRPPTPEPSVELARLERERLQDGRR
jgi:hypothetical protein